jgi:hypothetical protein
MSPQFKPFHTWRWVAGSLLLVTLVMGCGGLEKGGQPVISTPNAGVFAPSSTPYGKTYGEWSALWWQWALRTPERESPMTHADKAPVEDAGPVVFLAGTFGMGAERSCTVPAGKAILFPVVNWAYFGNLDSDTEPVMRAGVKYAADHATNLWASVDGVPLHGLQGFRFQSPDLFLIAFDPVDPLFGPLDPRPPYPPLTYPCFADGFWVMLEPLAPGEHTLAWGGKAVFQATYPNVDVFEQDITYHVTVE